MWGILDRQVRSIDCATSQRSHVARNQPQSDGRRQDVCSDHVVKPKFVVYHLQLNQAIAVLSQIKGIISTSTRLVFVNDRAEFSLC